MRKIIILSVAILFLAGCKTAELLGLKEMPITQVAAQEAALRKMEVIPVTQVVEEMEEREKLYSLSAKDMELRKMLFMFAEELPEYNVVIDPDVSGSVTVDFKELSLDNVMTILLEPLGLEYTIEDKILRISKPRTITRNFEFVYSTSSRKATSAVRAVTGAGEEGGNTTSFGAIEVEESVDVWAELESGIEALLSADAGKLTTNRRVGYLTVTDYRSNMKKIEEYIDLFTKRVKTQINIRAKLLEVTLTKGSEFGIDWEATLKGIGPLSGKSDPLVLSQALAPRITAPAAVPPTGESRPGDVAELFALGKVTGNFKYLLTALKSQGTVTVLSSPEVSILNGQKAILSSVTQDVYFETEQSAGGAGGIITSTSANAFTFGVYLDVTPHVDSEGMITMEVHPSVSSFVALRTSGAASRPAIDTRETETLVTVKEGETILIAGLMSNSIKENISKIPLLGDIPYVGKVFRRENESNVKKELVILITPTIVGPRAKDYGTTRARYKMLQRNQFLPDWEQVPKNPK